MANVATPIVPMIRRQPLIAPVGEPEIWWTQYPKAEIIFQTWNESVTLAGVGDTQNITVTCNLPVSYGYTLMEASFFMYGVNVADWEAGTLAEVYNASTPVAGSTDWSIPLAFERTATSKDFSGNEYGTWYLRSPPPTKVVLAINGGAKLEIVLFNAVTNGAACTARFFARFLQYDLNQGFRTSINSPVLTR